VSEHEPSYYEIALTNRQVVVAFVILLACLLGSFFAGVWMGRGEAGTDLQSPAERQAEAGSVEELPFFSGGELGEGDGEPQAVERAAPPAAPDPAELRAEREARRRAERPAAPPPEDDELAGGEGPALGSDAPVAAPPEVRPEQPPVATSPGAPGGGAAAAPAGTAGPVIQVFSSNDRDQAERIIERLRTGGERPFMSPVEVGGQTMYRVRLGPFADRAEAESVADRVRRAYRLETWITQ
jgi:cell division septation protein DedD